MVLTGLLAIVCVACAGAQPTAPIPTRTPKPTFTYVVIAATATPVVSPTAAPSSTSTPTPSPMPTATANPFVNPLTGETVQDAAVLQRRPLLVRIGNDPEVRPQSGLSMADMVYEEAMDGWTLTRFTAIIWSQDPTLLRPIRSARLLTIELGHMLDGALVHSGANDQVRWLLSQSGLTDLDEFFNAAPYRWVQPTGKWASYPWMGRVETTAPDLRSYLETKGWEKAVRPQGFVFSDVGDGAPAGESAESLQIPYPRRAAVEFRYDEGSKRYLRFVQGEAHTDALTGEQLAAANVIVHYATYQETDAVDVNGVPTFNIVFTGEGRAQIFRDGVVIEAKWIRPGLKDFCEYVYLDGTPVPLRPGQTWVEVVPTDYQISWSPA